MKQIQIILVILACAIEAHAQYPYDGKRDNLWPFGYGYYPGQTNPFAGLTWLNYSTGSRQLVSDKSDIDYSETNATICNTNGELLLTTNGIFIYNSQKDIVPGCDTLNKGYWATQTAEIGYWLPQGALILPLPENSDVYYVFHSWMSNSPSSSGAYDVEKVYYTVVDVAQNFGAGYVDSINVPLSTSLTDTIEYGKLTACRHANGRDWWILFCNSRETKYRRILFDNKRIHDYGWFPTGLAGLKYTGLGQAMFTSDGNKYVNSNAINNTEGQFLDVYDFDRCTGYLSNPVRINAHDSCTAGGGAISPNNRYAYTTCGHSVFQYDLQAVDVLNSKVLVAEWDGFVDPEFQLGATRFYLMGRTPDGKIIINTPNSTRFLHVINSPNEADTACQVMQHTIELFNYNAFAMPNYPNFRLGPVDGSACDTLGIDVVGIDEPIKQTTSAVNIQAYPNPATNYCNVGFGTTLKANGQLIVYSLQGERVYETPLNKATIGYTLKTTNWPNGMYLCVVYEGTTEKGSVRIVKE